MINEGKFNPYLEVEVTCKDTNEGKKLVSFYGIKPNDMQSVLDRLLLPGSGMFRQVNPAKNVEKAWSKGGALFVIVSPDKINDFLNSGAKSIQSALISSGNYNNSGLLHLIDETASAMDSISKDEMNKMFDDARTSEVDMWMEYLNKVNDPETRKILELYSKIYGNTVYGHLLSLKNAMIIRNLNGEATFVLGKSTWAKFGRGIKQGAKKYPLWGASLKDNVSPSEIKAAMDSLGHGLEEFGDLGVAVQQAVMIQAGNQGQKGKTYVPFRYIGYDIADTYLYNPKEEDPLTAKPNISSNVVYSLNALAKEAEAKKKAEAGETIQGDDEMKIKTEKALAEMQNICAEKGIKPVEGDGEPSSKLATMLLDYYTNMLNNNKKIINVLKPENISQYAQDAVQLTLIMDGIALDQLNRFRHSLVYTQKEAAALAPVIRYVTQKLGRSMVNEEIGGDFTSQYKAALKQLGIKIVKDEVDMMKESFYRVFNKINKNIF